MECFQGAVALATVTKKTRFHNEVSRHLSPGETVRGCPLTLGDCGFVATYDWSEPDRAADYQSIEYTECIDIYE